MNRIVLPGKRTGAIAIPASKSQAHRLVLCAALGAEPTEILCRGISKDIAATIRCMNALGAEITREGDRLRLRPIGAVHPGLCHLYCGESGSTLRFLLPIVGALGARVVFHMEGRLPQRPLEPLDSLLRGAGMEIRREGELLYCSGRLRAGSFSIPGDISSQYISGLLMALPLLPRESRLTVTGKRESAAYITMTEDTLALGGIRIAATPEGYEIPGGQTYRFPARLQVEGDYSNAAFFLCAGALSPEGVRVTGLNPSSGQGDRAVVEILRRFGAETLCREDWVEVRGGALRGCTIDAAQIPDLIPVLSVVAALARGDTEIVNAGRLRLKESDRLESTARLLQSLGAQVTELPQGLVIRGRERLSGGVVDSYGDHRIAMSAAVAACGCREAVTVLGANCVEKSYPDFWQDFDSLKGARV